MTLRGMGIMDAATLGALEQVPRELFIPPALRHHSYENASLPIAYDQTISQPYVIARMTEALRLSGRELVLEIGCGSGYQAAILAHLCRRVYTIERIKNRCLLTLKTGFVKPAFQILAALAMDRAVGQSRPF